MTRSFSRLHALGALQSSRYAFHDPDDEQDARVRPQPKEKTLPIPTDQEMLVMAEIKAAFMEEAFNKLAMEFARRERRAYELAILNVRQTLVEFPVRRFLPPESAQAGSLTVKDLQERGLGDAIAAYDGAIRKIAKSTSKPDVVIRNRP